MNKGILLQNIIIILIIVASTIIVALVISSLLEDSMEKQKFNKAKDLMLNLDSIINGLLVESEGARRDVRLSADDGTFIVAGKENRIKYMLEFKTAIIEEGVTIREGNLEITSGGGITANERDVDGDGNIDLVLENDALLFAVRKLGSTNNLTSINASNITTRIENKLAGNVIVIPAMSFSLDDVDSSAGSGYTELSRQGSNIPSSSIRLYMQPSSGIKYEAIFTLTAKKDFIEMRINLLE